MRRMLGLQALSARGNIFDRVVVVLVQVLSAVDRQMALSITIIM